MVFNTCGSNLYNSEDLQDFNNEGEIKENSVDWNSLCQNFEKLKPYEFEPELDDQGNDLSDSDDSFSSSSSPLNATDTNLQTCIGKTSK